MENIPERVIEMRKAWAASDAKRDAGLKEPESVVKFRNISYGPYDQWNLLVGSSAIATEILARRLAPFGIDDESVSGQELIGYLNGRLQIASRVATQVYGEVLESVLRQLGQCYQ